MKKHSLSYFYLFFLAFLLAGLGQVGMLCLGNPLGDNWVWEWKGLYIALTSRNRVVWNRGWIAGHLCFCRGTLLLAFESLRRIKRLKSPDRIAVLILGCVEGIYLAKCVFLWGFRGIIICPVSQFPHIPIYCLCVYFCLKKRRWPVLLCLTLGILTEAYVNFTYVTICLAWLCKF